MLLQNGANINSHINNENKGRFQILSDKTFTMDTTQHSILPFYFTHKCKTECIYNANAGVSTDIVDGAYYICYFSTVAGAVNCPQIDYIQRFYYMDG